MYHVIVLKTHYKNPNKGFTIVELLLIIGIIAILLSIVFLTIKPPELLKRGRDQKRLSDMSTLERIISEYKVDNGNYPDQENLLRDSLTLPVGNTNLSNSNGSGWIDANVATYNSRLPIDPLNTNAYRYFYIQNGDTFELNCVLEFNATLMSSDGGNDPARYELGNNLSLISP